MNEKSKEEEILSFLSIIQTFVYHRRYVLLATYSVMYKTLENTAYHPAIFEP